MTQRIVLVAMMVLVAACGGEEEESEEPLQGVWVARLTGQGVWSGVVVQDGEAAVFLCGDGDKLESHTRWMRGQPSGEVVDVGADGFQLTADLGASSPTMTLVEPDGTTSAGFDIHQAQPDDLSGVYMAFDAGCSDGVIVFSSNADGSQVDALGAWCDDLGHFSRVTPILPWSLDQSLQAEVMDPAVGTKTIVVEPAVPTAIQP